MARLREGSGTGIGAATATFNSGSSAAHNILVALAYSASADTAFSFPAGWVQAVSKVSNRETFDIWYYPDCLAGVSSLTLTWTGQNNPRLALQIAEYPAILATGPLDRVGTSSGNGTALTVSSSGNLVQSNELVIVGFHVDDLTATYSGRSLTQVASTTTPSTDLEEGLAVGTFGSPYTATATGSTSIDWIGVMATFKYAVSVPLAATAPKSITTGGGRLSGAASPYLATTPASISSGQATLQGASLPIPLVVRKGVYTFLAATLVSNTVIAELPLKGVSASYVLNAAGQFKATLSLDTPVIAGRDLIAATKPGRVAIYVLRDGVPLWGGIIWTRRYSPQSGHLELGGADFWSYFQRRKLTTTKKYVNVDQLAIVQDLVSWAQGVPSGNIAVAVGTETSGVNRNRTVQGYQYKGIHDEVQRGSQEDNGYDFGIDVDLDNGGNPRRTLKLHYPRRGSTVAAKGLVFEFPGNIIDYTFSEDATATANTTYAHGAGAGKNMTKSSATATPADSEIPLLESLRAFKDVGEQVNLDNHASADLKAFNPIAEFLEVHVDAGMDPIVGTYIQGDDVRARITDARFPAGLDTSYRITSLEILPPDGTKEMVKVALGPLWS